MEELTLNICCLVAWYLKLVGVRGSAAMLTFGESIVVWFSKGKHTESRRFHPVRLIYPHIPPPPDY